ncbi:gamma-tocopherol methyltransferase, chloroplastic-like [Rutidosis leptorrhynchoides]|uniref:gamma-tocopherol methyltransferase, chloroplastic-like n=1 Tax=Rutidosis leptorrhynchoides TaxID=125765 RepID=UPI003A997378
MSSRVDNFQLSTEVVTLEKEVGKLYDENSSTWEYVLGNHIHHGYYEPNAPIADLREAQFRMIEECLRFAGVPDEPEKFPKNVVDVGCGLGGSSLHMAKKYGAKCLGITLSAYQAQRANDLAAAQGLSDNVSFQVANALKQPFPDGKFDLVWSLESGEHMPEREKFVSELVRVAAPGAAIIIAAWCHRDLAPSEKFLKPKETKFLDKIKNAYHLAEWCSVADYVKLLESHPVQDIKSDDWTRYVTPFWPQVIGKGLTWRGFSSVLFGGFKTLQKSWPMIWMIQGYKRGVIKFGIVTCRKAK